MTDKTEVEHLTEIAEVFCSMLGIDLKRSIGDLLSTPPKGSLEPTQAQERILTDIIAERTRQDLKWGEQNHHPIFWISILGEEFGEAAQAANQATFPTDGDKIWTDYRNELVQTAAVAVGAIEALDRRKPSALPEEWLTGQVD